VDSVDAFSCHFSCALTDNRFIILDKLSWLLLILSTLLHPLSVCLSSQSLPDSLENTFVKGQVIQRHTRTHRGAGDGSKGRETSMFVWLVLAVYDLKFSVEIVFFFSPKTVSRTSLLTGQRLLIVAVNRQNRSQKQDGYGAISSSSYGPAGRGRGH